MDDKQIIELFWQRSEEAISETAEKYGRYCYCIANNVLRNNGDSEECVNDSYMRLWNSIPTKRPAVFKAFLGKIVRNLSLDRYEQRNAQKRGAGQIDLVMDELEECIPANNDTEDIIDSMVLADLMNSFLESLPAIHRKIFMRRYWYFSSVKEIARDYGMSGSNVKTSLYRSRKKLEIILREEGYFL